MAGSRADVYGPAENALTKGKTNAFIQSFLEAGCYEKGNKQKPCWRVVKNGGFNGPDDTQKGLNRLYEDLFDRIPQNVTFDLIIVDDSANGIRGSDVIAERLKKSIGKTTRAVIYKLFRPLGPACKADNETSCGLFQSIQDTCQAGNVPLVVIIDVNDLRAENAGISRGLSWERTSWEIIRHLQKNPTQVHFSKEESIPSCWVLVRMGLEAVLILPPGSLNPPDKENRLPLYSPCLVYDPIQAEDDLNDQIEGSMVGFTSAFTAAVAFTCIEGNPPEGSELTELMIIAAGRGLFAARNLLIHGFEQEDYPYHPVTEAMKLAKQSDNFLTVDIPYPPISFGLTGTCWSVISTLGLRKIEQLAVDIVKTGIKAAEKHIPVARFGKLNAVTLSEIESYRAIQRLIREYRDAGVQDRPLCIGVFGKPGSGKSFGVKQVVKHLLGQAVDSLTFNLSEFRDMAELSRAFHQIHNKTRDGKTPLVFFDEFDATHDGKELAWLKYFLAPMQDGLFNDGSDIHPIGRAVFVFAGGTKHDYKAFADQSSDKKFIAAKGPDFLSRLRGFIDIMGTDPAGDQDYACLLRRAVMLRIFLEERAKTLGASAHWLLDRDQRIHIDSGVLRAFLKVPIYRNGARSMASLVEVSALSSSHGFIRASLPSTDFLNMYTLSHEFNLLVNAEEEKEPLFLPAREKLAEMVHQNYCSRNQTSTTAVSWEKLDEGDREQNRWQVDRYLAHLKQIGCDVEIAEIRGHVYQLGEEDIDKLAMLEHDRWCESKYAQGWKYGPVRNNSEKIHPDLVPWDILGIDEKKKDIDAVSDIPEMLKPVGLKVVKY